MIRCWVTPGACHRMRDASSTSFTTRGGSTVELPSSTRNWRVPAPSPVQALSVESTWALRATARSTMASAAGLSHACAKTGRPQSTRHTPSSNPGIRENTDCRMPDLGYPSRPFVTYLNLKLLRDLRVDLDPWNHPRSLRFVRGRRRSSPRAVASRPRVRRPRSPPRRRPLPPRTGSLTRVRVTCGTSGS